MRVCGYTIVCGSVRAIVCVCEQERERKNASFCVFTCVHVFQHFARKHLISNRSLGASWLADASFNLSL